MTVALPSPAGNQKVLAESEKSQKSINIKLCGGTESSGRQKIMCLFVVSTLAATLWVVFFHNVLGQAVFNPQQHSDYEFFKPTIQKKNETIRLSKNQNGRREAETLTITESTEKAIPPPQLDQRSEKTLRQAKAFVSKLAGKKDSRNRERSAPQNATSLTEAERRCFPYNSQYWLSAGQARFGNSNYSSLDDDYVRNTIINTGSLLSHQDHVTSLLQQTLCVPKSQFLSLEMTNDEIANPTNETLHHWSLKLIYMAAHLHQHLPAKAEAEVRLRESCAAEMESNSIGPFDYECPDTKFLIIFLEQKGLGAVMRLGAVNALTIGIASNRTVVFVNNSPTGLKMLRNPWLHASCPRRDSQCFYLPITPCVLTNKDILFSPLLERGEARLLFKNGEIPKKHEDKKAVIVNIILRPQKTPATFRQNVVNIVNNNLIGPLMTENPSDPRLPVLQRAAELIYETEPPRTDTYYYFGHNVKHNHALIFYAMRPNHHYAAKLKEIIDLTFSESFDPELALGLPIRASDKCIVESECRSFDEYMKLMDYNWKMRKTELLASHSDPTRVQQQKNLSTSIIVTSEAASVLTDQAIFQRQGLHKNLSFSAHFVNNGFDRHQGSGNPNAVRLQASSLTFDEIMLSSISTLKVQLHARYTVGNCCSNFHLLLFDFLKGGCGVSHDPITECLQDSALPEFRLCCEWSKTEECLAKKQQ